MAVIPFENATRNEPNTDEEAEVQRGHVIYQWAVKGSHPWVSAASDAHVHPVTLRQTRRRLTCYQMGVAQDPELRGTFIS